MPMLPSAAQKAQEKRDRELREWVETQIEELEGEKALILSRAELAEQKCEALEALGVRVQERVPVLTAPTPENYKYLRTKQDRMGHRLELD